MLQNILSNTVNMRRALIDIDKKICKALGWHSVIYYLTQQQWVQRAFQYFIRIQQLALLLPKYRHSRSYTEQYQFIQNAHDDALPDILFYYTWIKWVRYALKWVPIFDLETILTDRLPVKLTQLPLSDQLWYRLFFLHLSALHYAGFSLHEPKIYQLVLTNAKQNLWVLYKQNKFSESELRRMVQQLQQHCLQLYSLQSKQVNWRQSYTHLKKVGSRQTRIVKRPHATQGTAQLPLADIRAAAAYRLLKQVLKDVADPCVSANHPQTINYMPSMRNLNILDCRQTRNTLHAQQPEHSTFRSQHNRSPGSMCVCQVLVTPVAAQEFLPKYKNLENSQLRHQGPLKQSKDQIRLLTTEQRLKFIPQLCSQSKVSMLQ